jgi:GNAT superfamily N-acetyltransferase
MKVMDIKVRPLNENDLPEADRVIRLAFGTFLGLADPMTVFGDSDFAYTRFAAAPDAALAAEVDGKLAGSNFATKWGSVGFFGPLSVEPRFWEHKIAQRLLEPTMDIFAKWGCRHTGLFTFSHSPKHAALYQKFGFWPRFLTPVMSQQVGSAASAVEYTTYSRLGGDQKNEVLAGCRDLTNRIYDGLDVTREIRVVDEQHLGDTILLADHSEIVAFAVCHVGPKTEAGSGACYAKFAAVRPGNEASPTFDRLLTACETFTASRGVGRFIAGVNMARHEAYRIMVGRGFRTDLQGVTMHRENDAGYSRTGIYVLDDWR